VANTGVRRNDLEIPEPLLAPAQKRVTFDIALHFEFGIERESPVVPNLSPARSGQSQLSRKQRIIFFGSPPSVRMASRMAARSTTAGTPVKILQQDARRHK